MESCMYACVSSSVCFLGFGVMPPTATWGNIITRTRQDIDPRRLK